VSTKPKSTLGTRRDQGPSAFAVLVPDAAPAVEQPPAPAPAPAARITPELVAKVNALVPEDNTKPARRARARRKQMTPIDVTRPVLYREEAEQYLGIGRSKLLSIAQAGRDSDGKLLGHTRVGARLAFLREDLDRYLRGEEPRAGARVGWAINAKRSAARKAAAQ
jgi:hypothetical protein